MIPDPSNATFSREKFNPFLCSTDLYYGERYLTNCLIRTIATIFRDLSYVCIRVASRVASLYQLQPVSLASCLQGVIEIGTTPTSTSPKDWKPRLVVLKRQPGSKRASLDYYKDIRKRWQKQTPKGVISLWPWFQVRVWSHTRVGICLIPKHYTLTFQMIHSCCCCSAYAIDSTPTDTGRACETSS